MKKLMKKLINSIGLEIKKINSLGLVDDKVYQNFSDESLKNKRFYNIGAGSFKHKFWTNIDYESEAYKGVQSKDMLHYDLMEISALPLKTDSAEVIYSSHTIEHINDIAVQNMFNESHRVLKSGGIFRVTTPDARLYYNAYMGNDILLWDWIIKSYSKKGKWENYYTMPLNEATIEQIFLFQFASQLSDISMDISSVKKYSSFEIKKILNSLSFEESYDFFTKQCIFNSDFSNNHINWFTHKKLFDMLKVAGFKKENIYISAYGQSQLAPLRNTYYFDNTHPQYSLYIEAVK